MQCGADERPAEDGAEKDVMTVLRDDLHAALNATRIVQENMSAMQKKLRAAQFEHGPLNNSLRAALDELRTSQIAFALLQTTYIEAQKASCELNELPTTEKQLRDLRMTCTLAERTRVLAHKAYAGTYARVRDAEKAILQHKQKLAEVF